MQNLPIHSHRIPQRRWSQCCCVKNWEFISMDLVNFFPSRYIDCTTYYKINELQNIAEVQIIGKIINNCFGLETELLFTLKNKIMTASSFITELNYYPYRSFFYLTIVDEAFTLKYIKRY
jgi:hypothetical protein